MAQIVQIKRRIPGTGKPTPGTALAAGEMATSISAAGATGIAELYIGDGTYVHDLVSAARQVELIGTQTINGAKTFAGAAASMTIAVDLLHITGGDDGDILSTDGAGVLEWIEPPKGVETGTTPPTPADVGDLFYNTTTRKMMVYNGTTWEVVNGIFVGLAATAYPGTPVAGSARFDTDTLQLLVHDGTTWHNATGNRHTIAATAPTTPAPANGDLWYDTADTTLMMRVAGAWVSVVPPSVITAFDATETYAIGDFVVQAGNLYRATAANGPGAFNAANWVRVATMSDVQAAAGIDVGTTAPTPPNDPGDLWYNTTTQKLMVYNGTTWIAANGVVVAATVPAAGQPSGSMWLNSTTNVLSVFNGTTWHPTNIISAFSTTAAYAVGNLVTYNGNIYRAIAAVSAGAWDGDDWVQITGAVDDVIGAIEIEAPLHGNGLTGITGGAPFGVTMATNAQVNVGTDNVYPIDSASLRSLIIGGGTGTTGGVAALMTTNKLIVPAINELHNEVVALTGALRFVGNFDADDSEVTTADTGTLTVGANLPAASSTNEGWFVIVVTAGTPVAPAPTVSMQVGDWVVSTGTAWLHIPLYHIAVTAANVGLTTLNGQSTWTNVQLALQGIYTQIHTAGNAAVLADQTSVLGDGTSVGATGVVGPLRVGTVDGGTF